LWGGNYDETISGRQLKSARPKEITESALIQAQNRNGRGEAENKNPKGFVLCVAWPTSRKNTQYRVRSTVARLQPRTVVQHQSLQDAEKTEHRWRREDGKQRTRGKVETAGEEEKEKECFRRSGSKVIS